MRKLPPAVPWAPYVQARVRREPEFAQALLEEAFGALAGDEIAVARNLVRDVIKGTLGYRALALKTCIPEKSLVRMFGPRGNPTLAKLTAVLIALQRRIGVRLEVRCVPLRPARRRAA